MRATLRAMKSRERAAVLLAKSGITINGKNAWDPKVHNEALFDRVFAGGTLALGESYIDGWWDVEDLSEFIFRLFRCESAVRLLGTGIILQIAKSKILNLQSKSRAFEVGKKHYDIGNDLYERMLDTSLVYSCGYWKDAHSLDEAQEAKFDLVCRKLDIQKGQRVLDIGCGWGGFAVFAAERYGASVVGITISKEQADLAQKRAQGLPIEIRLQDYRDVIDGPYDHIVSIGMFEHVGHKNYHTFMSTVRNLLKDDGLFLLHTIGHSKSTRNLEPWFHRYIFPNGHVPSAAHITEAFDRRWFGEALFRLEDWHNFGADYDPTLLAWFKNFDNAWPELKQQYDERFYRMWKYYLLVSAGMFRARYLHLWQIVFSKKGVMGGYRSTR